MALKMAKGSLFAILLRSTWWYSILIGLFILGISLLITDAQYVILSITGSLPFFGIGTFAAYKQLQQPSPKRVLEATEEIQKLSADIIAEKIAANYIKSGYVSAIYKGKGADLELNRGSRKLLLSTKRFKAANMGVEPLKRLISEGEKAGAVAYLYVTLGDISAPALDYAKEHNIELIQASRLVALYDGKAKIE